MFRALSGVAAVVTALLPLRCTPVPDPLQPRVHSTTAAEVSASWRPGCPVHYRDLRTVDLNFVGFDGTTHRGRLVVHRTAVPGTLAAFRLAFITKFPIRRMQEVSGFGGDDNRSMAADNTSAFNCRRTTNGTSWSTHAYGRAIDINPVENPYVYRPTNTVSPVAGRAYLDRGNVRPGMLTAAGPVVRAFQSQGFVWFGTYDYQHVQLGR